jgi:hypothetical protein
MSAGYAQEIGAGIGVTRRMPALRVDTQGSKKLVPMDGLELSTFALRMRCSTN